MITHFQYQNLYADRSLPGWKLSFFYKKARYTAIYHPDGKIEWTGIMPSEQDEKALSRQIHELMLFHVYD
jgi:hypothetical protein